MTFTFDPSDGFSDLERVRWDIGDINASAPMYQDEVINALITEKGSWQGAVIAALEGLIVALAGTPNFTADWLKVDVNTAIANFRKLLEDKRAEYGISTVSLETDAVMPTRSDREAADAT